MDSKKDVLQLLFLLELITPSPALLVVKCEQLVDDLFEYCALDGRLLSSSLSEGRPNAVATRGERPSARQEHIEHLAPRAALLVEGSAFQKLSRVDAAKLRSQDGVKHLIKALGGSWGRTDVEETYDLFERALYMVNQKQDETNDSYLARHDVAFEDLLSKSVSISDIRAYVLIRQSALGPEDRKKIIIDNQGKLTYDAARRSLRLLCSKFFQELQGGRGTQVKKAYDVYTADDEESIHQVSTDMGSNEIDEDQAIQMMADQGDEDAAFIAEFEDQIVDALQDNVELSSCFVSYQEARARVRERARSRGFWPVKGKSSGKGAKKGKSPNGWNQSNAFGRRRSLADRIANSTCRICGLPGHWKRECPQRQEARKTEAINLTVETEENEENYFEEVVNELPADAEAWKETVGCVGRVDEVSDVAVEFCFVSHGDCPQVDSYRMLSKSLHDRLLTCCRKHGIEVAAKCNSADITSDASPTCELGSCEDPMTVLKCTDPAEIFQFEESCHEAIIDTGASRAVVCSERLEGLIDSSGVRDLIYRAPSKCHI
eukprot:s2451_g7.t1